MREAGGRYMGRGDGSGQRGNGERDRRNRQERGE